MLVQRRPARRRMVLCVFVVLLLMLVFLSFYIPHLLSKSDEFKAISNVDIRVPSMDEIRVGNNNHLINKLSDNKNKKGKVIVGYCCDSPQHDAKCPPQTFVHPIAEGIFPYKKIIYQQCTQQGLAPYWTINYTNYSINDINIRESLALLHIKSFKNKKLKSSHIWLKPDIYICQGFFYHKSIIEERKKSTKLKIDSKRKAFGLDNDIRLNSVKVIYKHEKNRAFLLTYNSEPWGGGHCDRYDILLDSQYDRDWGCPSFHVPPSYWFEHQRKMNDTNQLIRTEETNTYSYLTDLIDNKYDFALFLVRDCFIRYYRQDTLVRVIFYMLLSESYKQVTSLGGCKRNMERYKKLGMDYCPKNALEGHFLGKKYNCIGYGWTDGVVNMLKHYKFYLAMENSRLLGYSTEKIMNAFYSRSIPIYFGDDMIDKYLNPKSFIQCFIDDSHITKLRSLNREQEYEKLEKQAYDILKDKLMECVEKVRLVDENETLYRQMLKEPIFYNNNWKGSLIDGITIGKKIRKVLKLHESYLVNNDEEDTEHYLNDP